MKKVLLLFCLITFIVVPVGAQNCKKIKIKEDSFTNKVERYAKTTIGNLTTKWLIEFSQIDGKTTMKWGIAMQGEFNERIKSGTSLLLKLQDGKVINLPTENISSPVTQVTGGSTVNVFSVYYLDFNLPDEELNAIAESPIVDFKIEMPSNKIKNPKIKSKQMSTISKICECLKVAK